MGIYVFKSTQKGTFADIGLICPGDWLYFLNQNYSGIEHSAIFIGWINKEKRIAKTLDYVCEKSHQVGKYTRHQLLYVYNIIQPKRVQSMGVKQVIV